MPDLAKQFNKEQIEAALDHIINEEIDLNPSTKHDLVYNGFKFPPKEVVRWAARLANLPNWESMTLSGGDNTNIPLKDLGFTILPKNGMNVQERLIEDYKKIVKSGNEGEVYKWELIEKYKGRPRLDALDFGAEVMEIDYKNLIYHNGVAVRNHIAKERPEEYRRAFIKLFDDKIDLENRIITFRDDIDLIYKSLGQTLQNHHDERTIATFLAFYNPNEYALYKNSFYSKYCKLLKIKEAGSNEKYIHYLKLTTEFVNNYILNHEDIIEIKNKFLTKNSYHDGNNLILAQDILYQTLDKKKMNFEKLISQIDVKLLEKSENPNFSILNDTYGNKGTREWIWIADRVKIIGNETAHYELEIDEKKGNNVILCLHFEEGNSKAKFSGSIGKNLPPKLKWFSWFGSKSIRFKDEFNLNGEDTVARIIDALSYFEDSIGNDVRKLISIINNQKGVEVNLSKKPLNQILYGPPGTGKTFHTVNKALAIIEGKEEKELEKEKRSEIKSRFDKYLNQGQIVFTTFHQSLSYEDFIEGIKPAFEENEEKNGDLDYKIEDGIFKQLCIRASYELLKVNQSDERTLYSEEITFDDKWSQLINEFEQQFDFDYKIQLKTKNSKIFVTEVNDNGNLILKHNYEKNPRYLVSYNRIKKLYSFLPSREQLDGVSNIDKTIRDIIGGCNASAYYAVLIRLYEKNAKINIKETLENDNLNYTEQKEIVEKSGYEFLEKLNNDSLKNGKPFILIIDEINRGNVSQIFGELITLIEESKRLGRNEVIKILLPYSKKHFTVPANLYIVGTMNTADRSVEALDTALRRRFCFEEMMPNYSLLNYNYSSYHKLVNFHKKYNDVSWKDWDNEYKEIAVAFYTEIGLRIEINSIEEKQLYEIINSNNFNSDSASTYLADYKLSESVNLKELLKTINKRIELLYDREHQIGHTFFLKIKESLNLFKDLRHVFQNEIIPLLQEYFFGDYEKLGLVLGHGFITVEEPKGKFFADFKGSTPSDYYKPIYSIKSEVFENDENFKNALNLTMNVKPEVINKNSESDEQE